MAGVEGVLGIVGGENYHCKELAQSMELKPIPHYRRSNSKPKKG